MTQVSGKGHEIDGLTITAGIPDLSMGCGGSNKPIHKRGLTEIPREILNKEGWPWWRRRLSVVPRDVQERIDAWTKLVGYQWGCDALVTMKEPESLIFGDSRQYWDCLQPLGVRDFSLHAQDAWSPPQRDPLFNSPCGPLMEHKRIPGMTVDGRQLDGMRGGKSSNIWHSSIDAFGLNFIDYLNRTRPDEPRLEIDAESLRRVSDHSEIRLMNGGGYSDTLSMWAWDDRLFAINAGGSHHLAAAIHIAARIGAPLPLTGDLWLCRFNEQAAQWLLDTFHLFLIPSRASNGFGQYARLIVGAAACLALPPRLCDGHLLAIPKGTPRSTFLAKEISAWGHGDFGVHLQEALNRQRTHLSRDGSHWQDLQQTLSCDFGGPWSPA